MLSLTRLLVPLLVATGLGLSASVAQAAPGITLGTANIRSGPGTSYGIVATLKKGVRVEVMKCSTNWCYVIRTGPDGWIKRSLLVNPYYSTKPYYQFPPKNGPGPGRYAGTPDKPL